jgi:hypothetical protein
MQSLERTRNTASLMPRSTLRSLTLAVAVVGVSSLLVVDGIKSLRDTSRIRPRAISHREPKRINIPVGELGMPNGAGAFTSDRDPKGP